MIRVLLLFLSLLFSSLASAFVLPVPTPAPATPIAFPSAQALPQPMGSGTAGAGQILSKVPGGQTAAVICMTVNCSSTMAMIPQGIIPPAGWPTDQSGTPQPPSSMPPSNVPNPYPPGTEDAGNWGAQNVPDVAKGCTIPGGKNIHLASFSRDGSSYGYQCTSDIPFPTGNSQMWWVGGSTVSNASSCPSGYLMSAGVCAIDLSGGSGQVQKPSGTSCQVIMSNGQPHWDTSNLDCASHGAGPYWTDSDGNKQTLDTGNGTFSVISSDGKTQTQVGPTAGNVTPITTTQTVTDTDGKPHTVTTVTNVDGNGNVVNQTKLVDGIPITQDNLDKLRNGTPSNALPTTGSGSGSTTVDITCEKVGTCGVAQDSTLKDVAAKTGAIQTSLSDFFKNFTTAVAVPQLYTPSTTTAQSALQDFSNQIKATPIVTSVTGFFDVNFQGGACPTWTIPVVNVMGLSIGGIEIDQFCTPTAYRVYSVIGVVTIVVCGFFAFRVAVDN